MGPRNSEALFLTWTTVKADPAPKLVRVEAAGMRPMLANATIMLASKAGGGPR